MLGGCCFGFASLHLNRRSSDGRDRAQTAPPLARPTASVCQPEALSKIYGAEDRTGNGPFSDDLVFARLRGFGLSHECGVARVVRRIGQRCATLTRWARRKRPLAEVCLWPKANFSRCPLPTHCGQWGETVCYDRSGVGSRHTEATTTRGYAPSSRPTTHQGNRAVRRHGRRAV